MKINVFWFRRDLRLDDNTALIEALADGLPVLPVFMFDTNITDELPSDDPRITFIFDNLSDIDQILKKSGSSLLVLQGDPVNLWRKLIIENDINAVFINKDYEPYSISRDLKVEALLRELSIPLLKYKDQVLFEEKEIQKSDGTPYTVFTPYKRQWIKSLLIDNRVIVQIGNYIKKTIPFPSLADFGFKKSSVRVLPYDLQAVKRYNEFRDFPAEDGTTLLGPHLRFGTVSIRKIVKQAVLENEVFLGELAWREFFMQILFSFPNVVTSAFRKIFDNIQWRNNEKEFDRWCKGETGYPLVDAGMRQMNESGYMHNRVRMVAASFLTKHLLTDWRWGEAYFAAKLLDYELASNNGNWQWVAGTGCDAAPYFRVFNPETQLKRFDKNKEYVRRWVHDYDGPGYPEPMVDHDFARKRVIEAYKNVRSEV